MHEQYHQRQDAGRRLYAPLWLPVTLLLVLLVMALATEFALTWQSHQRLEPVRRHITQMVKLQAANLALQRELLESLRGEGRFDAAERRELGAQLQSLLDEQRLLSRQAPGLIAAAHRALTDISQHPKDALMLSLSQTRQAIDLEARAHQALVDKISRATTLELRIGAISLVLFPLGVVLLLYLMRRRILAPLARLSFLMSMLARPDYARAPLRAVDPLLVPLTENYNALVSRLAELEAEHERREKNLQAQVDIASQALLRQQRSLASTERLAALGEMMARIAHELCNPLAGVKLACRNLRKELGEQLPGGEYPERVGIIAEEIDRIIAVLNAMLDQSRHKPEPLSAIDIGRLVADLVTLMRYQLPAGICVTTDIPAPLVCHVPDAMLRQALLNLLLNAQQAIGGQPGSIEISAGVEAGLLSLKVCDDGPGFPVELLEAGIRAFVSHRPGGTGLGLSMVQRFARAQDGQVTLSNRPPRGACVTLELPCGNHYV